MGRESTTFEVSITGIVTFGVVEGGHVLRRAGHEDAAEVEA